MKRFKFSITGVTPIIMHADDVSSADKVDAWRKSSANKRKAESKAGDDRSPSWTWMTYVYIDGKNNVAWPVQNMQRCLSDAAKEFKIGQKTLKTAAASLLGFQDDYLEFQSHSKIVPFTAYQHLYNTDAEFAVHMAFVKERGEFALDIRRAVVGKAKHVRVRPVFSDWSISGVVDLYDESVIKPDTLKQIITFAGARVGLGDWRPGARMAPGRFGKFALKEFSAV